MAGNAIQVYVVALDLLVNYRFKPVLKNLFPFHKTEVD